MEVVIENVTVKGSFMLPGASFFVRAMSININVCLQVSPDIHFSKYLPACNSDKYSILHSVLVSYSSL